MNITLQGEVIRIQGDEFWHMTRVLRLGINDRFVPLLFFFLRLCDFVMRM
jgi:16S rRNA U1498 N3-methylase RsmE